jgi:phage-related protein
MEQGVRSNDFLKALMTGGVNRFFMTRPRAATTITTKCLRLTAQITHGKHERFTVTLRRTPENAYEVLAYEPSSAES